VNFDSVSELCQTPRETPITYELSSVAASLQSKVHPQQCGGRLAALASIIRRDGRG
jgi:hypothetical protein